MEAGRASQTAAWVATLRTLGQLLPRELVIADDPYGLVPATQQIRLIAGALRKLHAVSPHLVTKLSGLSELLLWMQLRTRFLDDLLLEHVRLGGSQVVLLGAGYDARSLRFKDALTRARIFEVDHPATQQHKRTRLPGATNVRYLPWDFEHNPLAELPHALEKAGLDPTARTLTIWEGVTMYLTREAIDESVRCVRRFGGEGSWLAFNYIEQAVLDAPGSSLLAISRFVKRAGEPYQSGFEPRALPAFLEERGFSLVRDVSDREIANEYWPLNTHYLRSREGRRIAVACSKA